MDCNCQQRDMIKSSPFWCVPSGLQAMYGNNWSEVAKHIPGRTGQQCAQRWRHKVGYSMQALPCTPCIHVL
jgi:hypothetical protein